MKRSFHYRLKEAQKSFNLVLLPIYIIEGCRVFLTVSTGSTVKGKLRLSEKIVTETRLDGFFAMVVDGVQRTGKTSYVSKGLAYANGE
jgi:hypothetical protein